MKKSDQTVLLFQKTIFSKPKSQLLNSLAEKVIGTKKPLVLFTPNPEQLVLAQKNPQFGQLLDQADYLIPDGIGLVWASRLLSFFGRNLRISERISGIDLTTDLLEWATQRDWQVLLLGGRGYDQAVVSTDQLAGRSGQPGHRSIELPSNGQTAGKLRLRWLEGYTNVGAPTRVEEETVVKTLRSLKPQLVLVAFGAPMQEQWVVDHLDLLQKSSTKIVMVVGGTFDIFFGRLRRAPLWMRSLGLEWLYRLLQEPHRARRQLTLIHFMGLVLLETLRSKRDKAD
jgi:N-acetylglucosaminyldiphosphoundecaprenol N-acetyl-beta-D-mannosaminyltransferase